MQGPRSLQRVSRGIARSVLTLAWWAGIGLLGGGCSSAPLDALPAAARSALENGVPFELYSLHPDRVVLPERDGFHGWQVLGGTTVVDPAMRTELITALADGVGENQGVAAGCFNPRHALRVTEQGVVHDFVICFECYQVQWFQADQRQPGLLVTASPQAAFDRILQAAGVQLAPTGG